jgi:hypothetical protein
MFLEDVRLEALSRHATLEKGLAGDERANPMPFN